MQKNRRLLGKRPAHWPVLNHGFQAFRPLRMVLPALFLWFLRGIRSMRFAWLAETARIAKLTGTAMLTGAARLTGTARLTGPAMGSCVAGASLLAIAGCSGGADLSALSRGLDAAAAQAQAAAADVVAETDSGPRLRPAKMSWLAPGTASEVYTRTALGLNRCHLGYGGDLFDTHLTFAEMPPGEGRASVIIHERTPEDRHGLKSFLVTLSEAKEQTTVRVENKRFDADRARQLSVGIKDWSEGKHACEPLSVAEIKSPPGTQPLPLRRPQRRPTETARP